MLGGLIGRKAPVANSPRAVLELSGPRLERSLGRLISGCEDHGGVESYVDALKLKSALFREALGAGGERAGALEPNVLKGLCAFMATVRRRIGARLERPDFDRLPGAIADLVRAVDEPATTDSRIAGFEAAVGAPVAERWVRDFAAEILHNLAPERFPLMMRWVWDAGANTGVIRELWFADDVDQLRIDVPDSFDTFLVLREELSQYLSRKGFFRDVLEYVDLLSAQVYADYICEQGGSYLRTDFSAEEDSMQFTRRLLGLDGVRAGSGRTRLKTIDGEAYVIDDSANLRLLD